MDKLTEMINSVEEVSRFRTQDGQLFADKAAAQLWEARCHLKNLIYAGIARCDSTTAKLISEFIVNNWNDIEPVVGFILSKHKISNQVGSPPNKISNQVGSLPIRFRTQAPVATRN
jgi:hypothetical protein